MIKILLMEDDLNLCQSIQQALKKEGYSVDCCNDGESAMIYALNTDYGYDLAIVDRMLPIIDGLTIIKAMRRKQIQIPVIIITGMSALDDRVDGLDSGADDYLIKPFHIRELMARVRALTRRPQQIQEMGMLSYADLHFDYPNRKVTCNGQELILTAKETELLSVLMKQPETSFSREQLVLKVWGSNADIEPGNLDNYISFLRKRLRELHSKCAITTIYGSGYRISGVSHDIRTPLSMIMGYAGRIAENESASKTIQEQAEIVRKQSVKIKELVQDLNLVSQLEYEMQPLHKEMVRLSKLLRSYVADLLNMGISDSYNIGIEIATDAENTMLECDARLISRAVNNLVQNSMKHNPLGCRILLSLRRMENTIQLIVQDDGIGLSEEKLQELKEKPHYLESTDERLDLRHGLGLVLVRQIVAAHEGTMTIDSKINCGCKIILTFDSTDTIPKAHLS